MSLYRIQGCQVDVCVAGRQILPPHFVDFVTCHLNIKTYIFNLTAQNPNWTEAKSPKLASLAYIM